MRVLRAKAARKTLGFYRVAFGLVPPYKVVLDGNFVHHAVSTVKTSVVKRLNKLLGKVEVKLLVPRAVLSELEALGEACAEALDFCKKYCSLIGESGQSPAEAILSTVAEGGFIVATQDAGLQKLVRRQPGVCLCHFAGTVLALDPPSKASVRAANKLERERSRPDHAEAQLATKLRRNVHPDDRRAAVPARRKKKKKAAGPNPLSCIKSTKVGKTQPTKASTRARRRRSVGPRDSPSSPT